MREVINGDGRIDERLGGTEEQNERTDALLSVIGIGIGVDNSHTNAHSR
jgi:hypothetical protein